VSDDNDDGDEIVVVVVNAIVDERESI